MVHIGYVTILGIISMVTGSIVSLESFVYSNETRVTFSVAGNKEAVVRDGIGTLSASFKDPLSISSDYYNQYIFVSDAEGNSVRQITRSTSEVTTIAVPKDYWNSPTAVITDNNDDLFISDKISINKLHRLAGSNSFSVERIAGSTAAGSSDGVGTHAQFKNPVAMDIDNVNKYIYISDNGNGFIRRLSIDTAVVTTIAINIRSPYGIAFHPFTNVLYVVSFIDSSVFQIPLTSTSNMSIPIDIRSHSPSSPYLFAGSPLAGSTGYLDGSLRDARFMNPMGLALDYFHGVLVLGDSFSTPQNRTYSNGRYSYSKEYSYSIRKISLANANVSTLAGRSPCTVTSSRSDPPISNCFEEGSGPNSKFGSLRGFTFADGYATILFTDKDNAMVRGACVLGFNSSTQSCNSYFGDQIPTKAPITSPSIAPSAPTQRPSLRPSLLPTSLSPTAFPSTSPSKHPTKPPSNHPTWLPSAVPTESPSESTDSPTIEPSQIPSDSPSETPTVAPSRSPTSFPPTRGPSRSPTVKPTRTPTALPSNFPSTNPSTMVPTYNPSSVPTDLPTFLPSELPSEVPSADPTFLPSDLPTTDSPSRLPTSPTIKPSAFPTIKPTIYPTVSPSNRPTSPPTVTPSKPSVHPTAVPSVHPSWTPTESTAEPSRKPSAPSYSPTASTRVPTVLPTVTPSSKPSLKPTASTEMPTEWPTEPPSSLPSLLPSQSTELPSCKPSRTPTNSPTERIRLTFFPTVPADGVVGGNEANSASLSDTNQFENSSGYYALIVCCVVGGPMIMGYAYYYYYRVIPNSNRSREMANVAQAMDTSLAIAEAVPIIPEAIAVSVVEAHVTDAQLFDFHHNQ